MTRRSCWSTSRRAVSISARRRPSTTRSCASARAGVAILLISVQLDELLKLADRILVMFNGRIMGSVDGEAADENRIGLMMAGVDQDEAEEAA